MTLRSPWRSHTLECDVCVALLRYRPICDYILILVFSNGPCPTWHAHVCPVHGVVPAATRARAGRARLRGSGRGAGGRARGDPRDPHPAPGRRPARARGRASLRCVDEIARSSSVMSAGDEAHAKRKILRYFIVYTLRATNSVPYRAAGPTSTPTQEPPPSSRPQRAAVRR